MKHQIAREFAVLAQMNDLLDEFFALVVARMRLAGKNELHRALLVVREFHDVVELLEDQRRAFVGGKPAREPDGQRVGIQQVVEPDVIARRDLVALLQQAAPGEFDQFAAQPVAQCPQLLVREKFRVHHALPEFSVCEWSRPSLSRRGHSRPPCLPAFRCPRRWSAFRARTAARSLSSSPADECRW